MTFYLNLNEEMREPGESLRGECSRERKCQCIVILIFANDNGAPKKWPDLRQILKGELTILVAGLNVGMREGKESKMTLGVGLRTRWMREMRLSGLVQEFCFSHDTLVKFFNT